MTTQRTQRGREAKITLALLAALTTGFLCDCALAVTFTHPRR